MYGNQQSQRTVGQAKEAAKKVIKGPMCIDSVLSLSNDVALTEKDYHTVVNRIVMDSQYHGMKQHG